MKIVVDSMDESEREELFEVRILEEAIKQNGHVFSKEETLTVFRKSLLFQKRMTEKYKLAPEKDYIFDVFDGSILETTD